MWPTGLAGDDMWDLPGPGTKLMPPALAGGYFTAVPPRKSTGEILVRDNSCYFQTG